MKLTVPKNTLLEVLQKLSSVIGSRSTLPILANVLIEAEDGTMTLTTTDLEIRLMTKIEAQIEIPGKTSLPAKRLLSLVSKFVGDTITIDCNLENHHSVISCGTAEFDFYGMPIDDFPLPIEFTPVKKFVLPESEMERIISQISYAVSLDDSRKVLHGLLFSIKENTFTAVATDGKRLALVEKFLDDFSGEEGDSIVPIKSANEAKSILGKEGDVTVEIGENQINFRTGKSLMTSKLIEGNYPNYRQVIPTSFSKKIDVSTSAFLSSLELVSIAIADSSSFMKLTFADNKLRFAASSDIGKGSDSLDIEYNETEISISFNPAFLSDPFKQIKADKAVVKLNDGFSPVAVEGRDGFLYVIMPMRNK